MEQTKFEDEVEDMVQHLKREGAMGSDRYGGKAIGLDGITDADYRRKATMLVKANIRHRQKRGEEV